LKDLQRQHIIYYFKDKLIQKVLTSLVCIFIITTILL